MQELHFDCLSLISVDDSVEHVRYLPPNVAVWKTRCIASVRSFELIGNMVLDRMSLISGP